MERLALVAFVPNDTSYAPPREGVSSREARRRRIATEKPGRIAAPSSARTPGVEALSVSMAGETLRRRPYARRFGPEAAASGRRLGATMTRRGETAGRGAARV